MKLRISILKFLSLAVAFLLILEQPLFANPNFPPQSIGGQAAICIRPRIKTIPSNTLLQLAQTQGQATAQIESQLQSAIQSINQQRQYLYDHQRQITFRKILFFKIPVYGKIDISPQLRQLDEMERQARDAASEQLALLDAEVALQKQKIEDDAVTALGELEKQRQTTYAEIIKQELRPVVLHYYRKVLGRDPDQAEINVWVNPKEGVLLAYYTGTSKNCW